MRDECLCLCVCLYVCVCLCVCMCMYVCVCLKGSYNEKMNEGSVGGWNGAGGISISLHVHIML